MAETDRVLVWTLVCGCRAGDVSGAVLYASLPNGLNIMIAIVLCVLGKGPVSRAFFHRLTASSICSLRYFISYISMLVVTTYVTASTNHYQCPMGTRQTVVC